MGTEAKEKTKMYKSKSKGRKGKIWSEYKYNTIAKWALGIIRTDKERIEPYEHHNYYEEWWNNISIMGIKKENNSSVIMNPDTVDIYAESNKDEIKKEIEIIDPDIIVCCSVYRTLMTIVYQYDTEEEFTEAFFKSESMLNNWCNVIPINGRNRLFIQYVEPGWPDLITYYGLVNIYQQALINGLIKR